MSDYRVVVLPRAEGEALAAFDWIAARSPDAAERWLAGLREAVAGLADNPTLNPVAAEASERFGFTIREALHGKRRGSIASSTPSRKTSSASWPSAIRPRMNRSREAGRGTPK